MKERLSRPTAKMKCVFPKVILYTVSFAGNRLQIRKWSWNLQFFRWYADVNNYIKDFTLNSRLFAQLCEDMMQIRKILAHWNKMAFWSKFIVLSIRIAGCYKKIYRRKWIIMAKFLEQSMEYKVVLLMLYSGFPIIWTFYFKEWWQQCLG